MANYNNRKEIFSELHNIAYSFHINEVRINEVRISSLNNNKIIEEIKTLCIIELDDIESFYSYVNYDHFLIFKFKDDYYFCITELVSNIGIHSMIKLLDFNLHLRKDKMLKINSI